MKHRCLVLDHDDTIVNSTATVHFPCFQQYLREYRPEVKEYTIEEFFRKNFHPGVVALFRDELGMDQEEMEFEQAYWSRYVENHIPPAYPGIREILEKHRAAGGVIAVVSHSYKRYILRDYQYNGLPEPDLVFGWDEPPEQRKPSVHPIMEIMRRLELPPEELLVLDDLKPGYDMAKAAGVPFAASGWSNDIPEIEAFMRKNCGLYFKTVDELAAYLNEG